MPSLSFALSLALSLPLAVPAPAPPCAAPAGEVERVRAHLDAARAVVLRAEPPPADDDARARRAALLDALAGYAARGTFPHNHARAQRTPVFIDAHGTPCAVAFLMQQSGHGALARQIAAEDVYVRLPVDDARIAAWAAAHGFTLDELARIQPSYGPTRAELVCETIATADDAAALRASSEAAGMLRARGHAPLPSFLECAARSGKLARVQRMLETGARVDARALDAAVCVEQPEIRRALFARLDASSRTARAANHAMRCAARSGDVATIELLVSHGADPDEGLRAPPRDARTVDALIDRGAWPLMPTSCIGASAWSPPQLGSWSRRASCPAVEPLQRALAGTRAAAAWRDGEYGWTALHDAALARDPQVLRAMLRPRMDPSPRSSGGFTPAMLAASIADRAALEALFAAGADKATALEGGIGLLHLAALSVTADAPAGPRPGDALPADAAALIDWLRAQGVPEGTPPLAAFIDERAAHLDAVKLRELGALLAAAP